MEASESEDRLCEKDWFLELMILAIQKPMI